MVVYWCTWEHAPANGSGLGRLTTGLVWLLDGDDPLVGTPLPGDWRGAEYGAEVSPAPGVVYRLEWAWDSEKKAAVAVAVPVSLAAAVVEMLAGLAWDEDGVVAEGRRGAVALLVAAVERVDPGAVAAALAWAPTWPGRWPYRPAVGGPAAVLGPKRRAKKKISV